MIDWCFHFTSCENEDRDNVAKYSTNCYDWNKNAMDDEAVWIISNWKIHNQWKNKDWNGILLSKLFWPTVRKKCSSYREKLLKFEAEGREFAKILRSPE